MNWKNFWQTFISALIGGIAYEVIIYSMGDGSTGIFDSVIQVLIIAFVVTGVIMLLRNLVGNKSSSD